MMSNITKNLEEMARCSMPEEMIDWIGESETRADSWLEDFKKCQFSKAVSGARDRNEKFALIEISDSVLGTFVFRDFQDWVESKGYRSTIYGRTRDRKNPVICVFEAE